MQALGRDGASAFRPSFVMGMLWHHLRNAWRIVGRPEDGPVCIRLRVTMIRRLMTVSGVVGIVGVLCCNALAQGTKLWTQSRYDEMERGTAQGVAIRSDGRLEVAPASSLLYATPGGYVWSIVADAAGNAYL